MSPEININKIIQYWIKSAIRDFTTAFDLYDKKKYPESLFFAHLSIEKLLKAYVVKSTSQHSPYTHNLNRLAELGKLSIGSDEKELLNNLNDFNIRARYPDYKLHLFKICSKKFTLKLLNDFKTLYELLCKGLK